jgi:putative endonuclease
MPYGHVISKALIIDMDKAYMDENYTYIVRCADGTLYTGWTNDLKKRIKAHNAGKGAKYTKIRRPVELVYFERFALSFMTSFIIALASSSLRSESS